MKISRRDFLAGAALASASMATSTDAEAREKLAAAEPQSNAAPTVK